MTRVRLIEDLKLLCEKATEGLKLPLEVKKGDSQKRARAPDVYRMRLKESENAKKYVPYIIVQLIDSRHIQEEGKPPFFSAGVRFIFAVYSEDEEEGAIMLLNVMDRVQNRLLKDVKIGKHFLLNVHEPLETLVYPDNIVPYFAGEMIGTFILPPIEREVDFDGERQKNRL